MANRKPRVPQEILKERYDQVAHYWVKGWPLKNIAEKLGVEPEDVFRYKKSKYCQHRIEQLGGSVRRNKVSTTKRVEMAKLKVEKASELSWKYKKEGLSNLAVIEKIAEEIEVDKATIYWYLKRPDWTGVKLAASRDHWRSQLDEEMQNIKDDGPTQQTFYDKIQATLNK